MNQPLNAPDSPVNKPVSQSPLSPNSVTQQPLPNGAMGTGESYRVNYTIPTVPNTVVTELEKRLQQAGGGETTDQQAMQQFHNQVPVIPGTGTPATRPGTPLDALPTPADRQNTPKAPGVNPAAPAGNPPAAAPQGQAPKHVEPLAVDTFSKGVGSPTLAGMLRNAEADMKQGKFNDAIEKFTMAQQASPNDSMIALGRANAALGAANYRTAEAQFRQAFGTRPALLMGKYDLNAMIGQDRLKTITTELTDLSKREPQETMAPFLLAYIDYNTGKESDAVTELNEVAKRQGQPDGVVKSMLQRWGGPATQQNK